MHDKKRDKILKLILSMIVILLITTITYAYYSIFVSNDNAQTSTVTSANISLTYTDCADTNVEDCANITASLKPGDSVTKTFQIENTGTGLASFNLYFTKIKNTFKNNELVYKIEDMDTGTLLVSETPVPYFETNAFNQTIKNNNTIEAGVKKKYKLTITFLNSNSDQSANLNASFALSLGITEKQPLSNQTLASLGLTAKDGSPDFNTIAETDETADGLYAMEDDYGTSYYFRGAVENNYVYFAGYYWRIIRINGDGSLRIIYDGTIAHANGESSEDRLVGTSAFNTSYNDNAYVGYMYGATGASSYELTHSNTNNSTIKTYIDNWYKTNIVDKGYAEAVSDEIFCNDRSIDSSKGTGLGYGTNRTYYKAYNRLDTNKSPQLTCNQKNDAFTVDDEEKGNGALTYPVGLITGDEIILSGGKKGSYNSSYYLYKGSFYWSLSSYSFDYIAIVFSVYESGDLYDDGVSNINGVAPVINLSADYCKQLVGTGTMADPYTVE